MVRCRYGLFAMAFVAIASGARAEEPPSLMDPSGVESATDAQNAALTLANEGLTFFKAQQWAAAYEQFSKAESRFHAPTLLLYMGHCQKQLGKLVAARDLYRRVADEKLTTVASKQFQEAQATAATELAAVQARVPWVSIAVRGDRSEDARVTVDGAAVMSAALGRVELDPGTHAIGGTLGSGEPVVVSVTLKEASSQHVELNLAQHAFGSGDDGSKPTERRGSLLPAAIALGVGVTGVVIGTVTGVISLNKVSEIEKYCDADTGQCPEHLQDKRDSATTFATVSTLSFIAGGIGVAAGTVLWVFRPGSRASDPQNGTSVQAEMGIGSVRITGKF